MLKLYVLYGMLYMEFYSFFSHHVALLLHINV